MTVLTGKKRSAASGKRLLREKFLPPGMKVSAVCMRKWANTAPGKKKPTVKEKENEKNHLRPRFRRGLR